MFSNADNERSIPSLVDGMKPGQRKVLFTCFKRADKREVKVAQLAGAVGELSAYHHGEASLMSTIVDSFSSSALRACASAKISASAFCSALT